jgi:alkanesulfonate monooxygenase SsuD/methylene tetrahydromethanopterin reductase-like flavin-dependent oxidoreductase (luciferase family)
MQLGIFSVIDITRNPVMGNTPSEAERIDAIVQIARRADEVGLDVFAIGGHHIPRSSRRRRRRCDGRHRAE